MSKNLQSVQASFTHKNFMDTASAAIDGARDIAGLLTLVDGIVCQLFKRETDATNREQSLLAVTSYFYGIRDTKGMAEADKLAKLRKFSKEMLQIVLSQRQKVAAPVPEAAAVAGTGRRADDRQQALREAAVEVATDLLDTRKGVDDVEKPTAIQVLAPIAPAKFDNFRDLFTAALQHRLSGVTRFFQRQNREFTRELVKPFLLTEEFEAKFMTVIAQIIVPKMYAASRSIAMLETSQNWAKVNSATFWGVVDGNEKTRNSIQSAWEEAWSSCKQRETLKKDADGQTRRVLTALPELKEIRRILAPDSPLSYDMPPVRNAEIELFISMLYDFDMYRLDYCFNKLRQLYEQELDRRWYQDKARQGALRDSLLDAIEAFPDRTGDFLALLCYYCFPNTDIFFLEKFTHNKGANHAQRVERLPYLMRFLSGDMVPEVRQREMQEKRAREEAAKQEAARQRELERERQVQL